MSSASSACSREPACRSTAPRIGARRAARAHGHGQEGAAGRIRLVLLERHRRSRRDRRLRRTTRCETLLASARGVTRHDDADAARALRRARRALARPAPSPEPPPRATAASSSATAIASSIRPRSGAWSTRRRSSSTTRATCTARGSPTRSKSRRSRAPSRARCGLNEALTEAICLAHDLGHTPFGHAGPGRAQRLHARLRRLRAQPAVAARRRRARGALCRVSAASISRSRPARGSSSTARCSNARDARRHRASASSSARQPGLEAQLANLADEIAYNNHDVDDGLRSGLITLDELAACALFARQHDRGRRAAIRELPGRRLSARGRPAT